MSTSPMRSTRPRPRSGSAPTSRRRGPTLASRGPRLVIAGLAAAVVVALAIAVAVGGSGGSGAGRTAGAGSDGGAGTAANPVARLVGAGDDPAVGTPLPRLSGTTVDGRRLTVAAGGKPTIVLLLAHWCPHCRAEVPVVQDWLDGGGLPDGVALEAVATANDRRRPNYPADEWLGSEGWTPPTLLDQDGAAADAVGLTGFPYWVFVDADGTILARTGGELTPAQLSAVADEMATT